ERRSTLLIQSVYAKLRNVQATTCGRCSEMAIHWAFTVPSSLQEEGRHLLPRSSSLKRSMFVKKYTEWQQPSSSTKRSPKTLVLRDLFLYFFYFLFQLFQYVPIAVMFQHLQLGFHQAAKARLVCRRPAFEL